MAAEPIPLPKFATQVDIDQNGNVTGQVQVNNSGVVKFNVTQYKNGYDSCIVNITSANITWVQSAAAGEQTIKVGNGGGMERGRR